MGCAPPLTTLPAKVAYRVKYVAHPHIGDEWCIYPTYDFTHCVQDALEDIDFSICTLEFETRRESYYWLLHHLDLFKPMVYEMSRLNISYVVLSKRKLLKVSASPRSRSEKGNRSQLRKRLGAELTHSMIAQPSSATRPASCFIPSPVS